MERETEGPTQCGDPTCNGAIDEATGCCILCGVEHATPCPVCERYGFHARGCPEGEPDAMDMVPECP